MLTDSSSEVRRSPYIKKKLKKTLVSDQNMNLRVGIRMSGRKLAGES